MWFTKKFKQWMSDNPRQAQLLRNFGATRADLDQITITAPVIQIESVDRLLRASGLAARPFLEGVLPTSIKYWQTTFAERLESLDRLPRHHSVIVRALDSKPLTLSGLEDIAFHIGKDFADMVRYTEYEDHALSIGEIYVRKYPDNDTLIDEMRVAKDVVDAGMPFLRKFEDYLFESGRFSEWNAQMTDGLKHVIHDDITSARHAKEMIEFAGWDDSDLKDVRRDSIDFSMISERVEREKGVGIHELPLPELFRMSQSKAGLRY